MSETEITISSGTWITRPGNACTEIVNDETDEVVGLFDCHGDAVLACCSKHMLWGLDQIQRVITDELPDGDPVTKKVITETEIERISEVINLIFAKIENEVKL